MDSVVIDGIKYIPEQPAGDIQIVILQRGFVFVGAFEQDGPNCTLRNAYNVRRWGTTAGLGELAEKGPLTNTKLDKAGTVQFHELTVVARLSCDQEAWDHV